jgi:hypothetical protein
MTNRISPDEADNAADPGETRLRQSASEDSRRAEPDAPGPAADAEDPGATRTAVRPASARPPGTAGSGGPRGKGSIPECVSIPA